LKNNVFHLEKLEGVVEKPFRELATTLIEYTYDAQEKRHFVSNVRQFYKPVGKKLGSSPGTNVVASRRRLLPLAGAVLLAYFHIGPQISRPSF